MLLRKGHSLSRGGRQTAGRAGPCVDLEPWLWEEKSVLDRLRNANLLDACEVTLRCDARWYLLDLFRNRPGQWIDLAYIDAAHCVEVDSFIALAAWTHLKPGGVIAFDDLDWIPLRPGRGGIQQT